MKKICVVGLGYVGLTLSAVLADVGLDVVGVDINEKAIEQLKRGKPHIHEPRLDYYIKKYVNNRLVVTTKIPSDPDIDTYIVAVATPVDKDHKVHMEYFERAVKEIATKIKKDDLLIFRSTVPVGTSRNVIKNILEPAGLKDGYIKVAFAPERTLEGKALEELRYLPQIIGGINEESVNAAALLFGKLTNTLVRVSSLETAEIIKQIDNVFRDVNFALGNEMGLVCEQLGVDAYEVAKSANMNYARTKIMIPGAGVGGACLPKDPYIFLNQLKRQLPHSMVLTARKLNESMPAHMVEMVGEEFSKQKKKIENSKIVLLGLAFKGLPETDDVRASPALDIADLLKAKKANIVGMDPVINKDSVVDKLTYVTTFSEALKGADCVIITNNHPRWGEIPFDEHAGEMKKKAIIIDGWNMLNRQEIERLGFIYRGVGIG